MLKGFMALVRRKPRPIPRALIPREVFTMPPADVYPERPRHIDPGAAVVSRPAPRTDRGVMPIRPGQAAMTFPTGFLAEARWQLGNGDWTAWRDASGTVTNPVAAIGGAWRVKGTGG